MKTPGAMSSPREEERMEGAAALWSWDGGSRPPACSQQEEAEPYPFPERWWLKWGRPGTTGRHGEWRGERGAPALPLCILARLGADTSSAGVLCTSALEQQDPPEAQMFLSAPSMCLPNEVPPPMADETNCESVLQLSQVCRHARGSRWLSLLGTAVTYLLSLSS